MLPLGSLQSAIDTLIANLEGVVTTTQVAGGELNTALYQFGVSLLGGLSAGLPSLPSIPSLPL